MEFGRNQVQIEREPAFLSSTLDHRKTTAYFPISAYRDEFTIQVTCKCDSLTYVHLEK